MNEWQNEHYITITDGGICAAAVLHQAVCQCSRQFIGMPSQCRVAFWGIGNQKFVLQLGHDQL
jgi:hypothetical protein